MGTRWVVLDCESSGLDPGRDRLLSIGAVALREGRIDLGSEFSVVLRQAIPSEASDILVHGISGSEQLGGVDGAKAMQRFAAYAGDAPLVAFHAPFDRALLARASKAAGLRAGNRWLDLAALAPALYPEHSRRCKALDDWLGTFGIDSTGRHEALADAYATARLFQVLLARARGQGVHSYAQVLGTAAAGQWLGAAQ